MGILTSSLEPRRKEAKASGDTLEGRRAGPSCCQAGSVVCGGAGTSGVVGSGAEGWLPSATRKVSDAHTCGSCNVFLSHQCPAVWEKAHTCGLLHWSQVEVKTTGLASLGCWPEQLKQRAVGCILAR